MAALVVMKCFTCMHAVRIFMKVEVLLTNTWRNPES